MSQIGPGLILAGSIVGTGELIATTGLGADVGYVFLWLILLSCVIKVFVQIELGRHAITHGQTTLAALDTLARPESARLDQLVLALYDVDDSGSNRRDGRDRRPGRSHGVSRRGGRRCCDGRQDRRIVGTFLADASGPLWATVTTLVAIALLLSGGYKRLEKITTGLVAS